jgi:molybdopterin molybdotransferase
LNEIDRPWHNLGIYDRLTPLTQAQSALAAFCGEIVPFSMRVEDAAGRIAAAAVCAAAAMPAQAVALIDGWAVAAEDTLGASSYGPSFASVAPVRVGFGAPVPPGRDAVLPEQSVEAGSQPVEILSPAAPGAGLRVSGGDFTAGESIVAAGTKLRPDHIALLRLAGVAEVFVRSPRVKIVSRGGAGDWIGATAAREGHRVEMIEARAHENLAQAMAHPNADLVILIADVDEALRAIDASGKIIAHGVAVQPGEAMGCGALATGAVPVIFSPNRIESALAMWLLLGLPSLRRRAGATASGRGESLVLTRKIVSNPGISDLVLLRRAKGDDGAGLWQPLATGDIPWRSLAQADAWLLVEPEGEGYAAGRAVFAHFL